MKKQKGDMMKKRQVEVGCALMLVFAFQVANAQFFTNDLTEASVVAQDFDEYHSSHGNSLWSYTNDYALAENGSTNTVLQGGAVLDWVDIDNDTARSYLGTTYPNWMGHSWTARIAVEAPSSTKPYIFFGLGDPTPKESYYNEPQNGQSIFVFWRSGHSNSKVSVKRNGSTVENTGAWQGDPGYDIYMTYNHYTKMIKFDVDNWNGGRFSGINVSTSEISVDGFLTDTNTAHIFFGANAKVTFGDFEVYEIETSAVPSSPQNLYAWPEVRNSVSVYWNEAVGATAGYCVYRSPDDVEENYVQIATNVMEATYTDTDVTVGETYYYKVSAVNDTGEGGYSNAEFAVPNALDIIGVMNNAAKASKTRWFYELFDGNTSTFMDDNTTGGYGGLDYGEGNGQEIKKIYYWLRNDRFGTDGAYDLVIDGVTNVVSRAQALVYGNVFEGSDNMVDWTVIAAITNSIPQHGTWNEALVTDATPYRYIRYYPANGYNNYCMADLAILTANDLTANGTPIPWLEQYGLTAADDEEDNDGDGLLGWEEYIAGTDPTNEASVLKFNAIDAATNGFILSWQSVEGKSYSIITNSNLVFPDPAAMAEDIIGQEDETSYTTTVSGAEILFYEVGVE